MRIFGGSTPHLTPAVRSFGEEIRILRCSDLSQPGRLLACVCLHLLLKLLLLCWFLQPLTRICLPRLTTAGTALLLGLHKCLHCVICRCSAVRAVYWWRVSAFAVFATSAFW